MRSRYSAFCTGQIDYLIATRHPSKRQGDDRQDLSQTIAMTEWLNLRVLYSQETAERGTVEFVAFFKAQGQLSQLHERSDFVCQDGRWYYLEGKHLPPLRLERNDPCWCGSGKKVKKCHGT
jgi:SEC-C motif-containing protein